MSLKVRSGVSCFSCYTVLYILLIGHSAQHVLLACSGFLLKVCYSVQNTVPCKSIYSLFTFSTFSGVNLSKVGVYVLYKQSILNKEFTGDEEAVGEKRSRL